MRVVTSEKTVYEFSELSESAQDRAIQKQAEYEYRTSREACIESIEANGYEFDEEGDMA